MLPVASKDDNNSAESSQQTQEDAPEPGPTATPTARQQKWLQANTEVFDKLIGIFKERGRDENRKLIAYSKQWPSLAEGVFYRSDNCMNTSGGSGLPRPPISAEGITRPEAWALCILHCRLDNLSRKAAGNPKEQGKLRALLRSLKNVRSPIQHCCVCGSLCHVRVHADDFAGAPC